MQHAVHAISAMHATEAADCLKAQTICIVSDELILVCLAEKSHVPALRSVARSMCLMSLWAPRMGVPAGPAGGHCCSGGARVPGAGGHGRYAPHQGAAHVFCQHWLLNCCCDVGFHLIPHHLSRAGKILQISECQTLLLVGVLQLTRRCEAQPKALCACSRCTPRAAAPGTLHGRRCGSACWACRSLRRRRRRPHTARPFWRGKGFWPPRHSMCY